MIKLPKAVGEELDIAKNELQISFDGYITDVLDHQGSFRNSFEYYSIHFEVIDKLADAWRYGYTVEKPKLYNLILNDDFNDKIICLLKQPILDEIWTAYETNDINLKHDEKYQFNQEEIDKYNEDPRLKNLNLNDYKVEVSADEN